MNARVLDEQILKLRAIAKAATDVADFLQARMDAEEPPEEEPVPPEEVPADASTEFSPKIKRMIRDELRKAARAMTSSRSRPRVRMDENYIDALAVDNLESNDLIESIARQLEL